MTKTDTRKKLSLFLTGPQHAKLKVLAGEEKKRMYEVAQDAIQAYLDQFEITVRVKKRKLKQEERLNDVEPIEELMNPKQEQTQEA